MLLSNECKIDTSLSFYYGCFEQTPPKLFMKWLPMSTITNFGLTSTLIQQALAACNATITFSLSDSSSMLIVFGSIWQNVNKGISCGYTCKTISNFRGFTNSPKDLFDNVPGNKDINRKIWTIFFIDYCVWILVPNSYNKTGAACCSLHLRCHLYLMRCWNHFLNHR